jgi:hypothetical protein
MKAERRMIRGNLTAEARVDIKVLRWVVDDSRLGIVSRRLELTRKKFVSFANKQQSVAHWEGLPLKLTLDTLL